MTDTIIQSVSVRPLSAALNQPFRIATGSHARLENALVSVTLADGTSGHGEAAPAPHITGETLAATLNALRKMAARLAGRSCADYWRLAHELREEFPLNHAASTAAEMAVLDALARHLEMPLRDFFGPGRTNPVIDMTVVIGSVAEAGRSAAAIYRRGIRAFKIKVGCDFDEDINRVLAVHKAGRGSPVYLDANEGFDAGQSLAFLAALKKHGVVPAFVEQPVRRGDWEGLAKVTRYAGGIGCCVGTDETVQNPDDAARVIRTKAAHAINLKTMKFGLLGSMELARLAQAAGLKLMIGGMMESALSMTASAQLASGVGGFSFFDLDTPLFIKDRVMAGCTLASCGVYRLEKIKAGIGVTPA
ncbi:MAG: dipeptide epimerase [Elusimicrobiaceae bacterium]|nr:dipeptide epimerase [Elusimicrobiaceae bacterium]